MVTTHTSGRLVPAALNLCPLLYVHLLETDCGYFSLPFKILSNVSIYLCTICVGIMSYYMADRKHRKAFLEARQSLEVKLNLEEQSQQQVRDESTTSTQEAQEKMLGLHPHPAHYSLWAWVQFYLWFAVFWGLDKTEREVLVSQSSFWHSGTGNVLWKSGRDYICTATFVK